MANDWEWDGPSDSEGESSELELEDVDRSPGGNTPDEGGGGGGGDGGGVHSAYAPPSSSTDPSSGGTSGSRSGGFVEKADIGSILGNFQFLFGRARDTLLWAWLTIFALRFVAIVVFGGGAVMMSAAGLDFEEGLGLVILLGGAAVGAIGLFMLQAAEIALYRPLRDSALDAGTRFSGISDAFQHARPRIPPIVAAFLLVMVAGFGVFGLSGFAAAQIHPALFVPVVIGFIIVGLLVSPLMYVMAAHDYGVSDAVSRSIELVSGNVLTLLAAVLLAFLAALGLGCVQTALGFIPILGQIANLVISVLTGYLGWLFYASVFMTLDEAHGTSW